MAAHAKTVPGTVSGQFSVSRTGAAMYQIPIDVPPGANGLKPSLAILYNSQAGSGLLGQGWSLSGLSVISRCPQTIAQDQTVHLPNLSTDDRFCLDGQRLIVTAGAYGAANSVYHTEIDSAQKVTAIGTAPGCGSNCPASFTVVDRAGMTRQYTTVLKGGDGVTPLVWLVTSIKDRYNNFINFQYNISQGDNQYTGAWEEVSEIDYGNHYSTIAKVLFTYSGNTPQRQDTYLSYVASSLTLRNKEALTAVTVADSAGNTLRKYTFGYQYATHTLLNSVTECAGDGWCYPATTFSYSGAAPGFDFSDLQHAPSIDPDDTSWDGQVIGDFDGDGLADYFYLDGPTHNFYVVFGASYNYSNQVNATFSTDSTAGIGILGAVALDLFGDGKQEILVPYFMHPGVVPNTPIWKMLVWNPATGTLILTDVPTSNGTLSGCASNDPNCTVGAAGVDIARKGQSSLLFASGEHLFYYKNTNGVLDANPVATGISAGYVSGKPPTMTAVNYSNSGQAEIYVAGTGVVAWDPAAGHFYLEAAGNFNDASNAVHFINGDGSGLSSAVVVSGQFWTLYQNTGSGFTFASNNPNNMNYVSAPSGIDSTHASVVDWYGDGRQEIVVPTTGNRLYLYMLDLPYGGFVDTGITATYFPDLFIDVNGDGASDLIFLRVDLDPYSRKIFFNKARPYLLNEVKNGLGHETDVGYVPLDAAAHGAYVQTRPTTVDGPQAPNARRTYLGSMYVVDAFAVDTGLFSSGQPQQLFTYYIYAGSQLDQWGRGYLGFSEVEAINVNSGLYTDVTYRQDFPYIGMVDTSTRSSDSSLSTPNSMYLGSTGIVISCAFSPITAVKDTAVCSGGTGFPLSLQSSATPGAKKVSSADNDYKDAYAASGALTYSVGGIYAPYMSSSVTQLYDLASQQVYETTTTLSTYETVASGTTIGIDVMPRDVTIKSNDPGTAGDSQSVHTHSDYGQETACPGHPTSVTVTHAIPQDTTGLSQAETFAYDGKCFLTSDVKQIADSSAHTTGTLTKTYVPDAYGNLLSVTLSDGATSRATAMVYDQSGRFAVSITNALGQAEQSTYDIWGQKLTDRDANGNVLLYQYDDAALGEDDGDGLGFKTGQMGPRVSSSLMHISSQNLNAWKNVQGVAWSYDSCSGIAGTACRSTASYRVTQTGSDLSSSSTEYDVLGRVARGSHAGFNDNETIIQDTDYDLLGRTPKNSLPHISTIAGCWSVRTFDVLNRVVTEHQPINDAQCSGSKSITDASPGQERELSYTYSKFKTTKTVLDYSNSSAVGSEQTVTTLNVLGKPASVIDPVGTTAYGYDDWGNLISSSPPGQDAVTMTYDSAGDKLSMHDPDMGAWTYGYDAYGELVSQVDAKGNPTTNRYDLLGRMVERDEVDGVTHWVYDIGYGAGIGKLAYTYGSNGVWEGFAYDPYGEPTDKITVVGSQEYWITTAYDEQGRASQILYPDMQGISLSGTPAAPQHLNVARDPNNSAVYDVTWDNTPNGAIYHVYRTPGATGQATANEIYSGPVAGAFDDTIPANGQYTWSLVACDSTTCSAPATYTTSVILPPSVPGVPQPPLISVQTSTTWPVTWLASMPGDPADTDTITYTLQKSSDNGQTFTAVSGPVTSPDGGLSYSQNDGSADGTYVYRVKACATNVCSIYSANSVQYAVRIQPNAVTNVHAPTTVYPQSTTTSATVNITWNAPTVNGGNLTYTLWRSDHINQWNMDVYDQSPLGTSVTASYSDVVSQNGVYKYKVQACDGTGGSALCTDVAYSDGSAKVTLPPSTPGTVNPPASDTHGTGWNISWSASHLPAGSSGSITYNLYEIFNGNVAGTQYIGSETDSNYHWTGVHNQNGIYTYEIQACSTDPVTGGPACTQRSGQGPGYNTVIMPPAPGPISMPAKVNFDGSFSVSWSESSGGVPITCYWVKKGLYDNETGNITWFPGGCNVTTTSTTYGSSTFDTIYIAVAACDTADVCSNFTQSTVGVQGGGKSPPTLSGGGNEPDGSDVFTWTTVSGTNHYMFYSSTQSISTGAWSTATGTNVGTATSRTVTLTSSQAAGHYYVEACDTSTCTDPSATKTMTHTAPAGVSVTGPSSTTDGTVSVDWNGSTGATSYKLFRSVEKLGAWQAYTQPYTGAATGYDDTIGLTTQAVRYYVQACNLIGCSGNSNVLTVTYNLTGCPPPPLQCQLVMPEELGGQPHSSLHMAFVEPAAERLDGSGVPERHPLVRSFPIGESSSMTAVAMVEPTRLGGLARQSEEPGVITALAGIPKYHGAMLPVLGRHIASAPVRHKVSGPFSSKHAYAFAFAGGSSKPLKGLMASHPASVQVQWPPRAIDPRLSMYPPLRMDPRIIAHYEAMGGVMPAEVRNVDCSLGASDGDCSAPPVGNALMVGYVYNAHGYLAEVRRLDDAGDAAQVLWHASSMDGSGHVSQEAFDLPCDPQAGTCSATGQTIDITSTFDGASGVLTGTSAQAHLVNSALTATYTWDAYNNLLHRKVTESVATGTAAAELNEYFSYDAENRLCDVGVAGVSAAPSDGQDCSGSSMLAYDAPGGVSIHSNGVYTGYTYGLHSQPHAVSSVNAGGSVRHYAYDLDGNLTDQADDAGAVQRHIDWTSFNKPSSIQAGAVTEAFLYGPSRERLVTSVTGASGTVTTTYIDGLFEVVSDSSSGNTTYKHYVLAGSARVAVETMQVNSSGQGLSDTLGFFVNDQVGSVIATITENPGGTNQQMAVYSHDVWGKARPVSGAQALVDPLPGTYLPDSDTMAGQHEGFASHEDLEDIGIVDMEGRIYDPELGRFLSPDPNVQYPDASIGYDRYSYVSNNPLSQSDPTGYMSGRTWSGLIVAIAVDYACSGVCGAFTPFLSGAAGGYVASDGDGEQTMMAGMEAMSFATVGAAYGEDVGGFQLLARSLTEGVIGGTFAQAGGGRFGDGFIGSFVASEANQEIGLIGGESYKLNYYSPQYMAARAIVSAIVGGTVSKLSGGDFADAAVAAAMQRLFNDDSQKSTLKGQYQEYFKKWYQLAVTYSALYDVNPDIVLGAGAFESSWCTTEECAKYNNAWGLRPTGHADSALHFASPEEGIKEWFREWGPRIQGTESNAQESVSRLLGIKNGVPQPEWQTKKYNSENLASPYAKTFLDVVHSIDIRIPQYLGTPPP